MLQGPQAHIESLFFRIQEPTLHIIPFAPVLPHVHGLCCRFTYGHTKIPALLCWMVTIYWIWPERQTEPSHSPAPSAWLLLRTSMQSISHWHHLLKRQEQFFCWPSAWHGRCGVRGQGCQGEASHIGDHIPHLRGSEH